MVCSISRTCTENNRTIWMQRPEDITHAVLAALDLAHSPTPHRRLAPKPAANDQSAIVHGKQVQQIDHSAVNCISQVQQGTDARRSRSTQAWVASLPLPALNAPGAVCIPHVEEAGCRALAPNCPICG